MYPEITISVKSSQIDLIPKFVGKIMSYITFIKKKNLLFNCIFFYEDVKFLGLNA